MSIRYAIIAALVVASLTPQSFAADPVSFNRDIRPILSDNCFQCHGPDEAKRKGGLRLDLRDVSTKKLASGHKSIEPSKPEESELVRRIAIAAGEEVMPPKSTGKKLTATQIELLQRWIAQGAE